MDTVTDGRARAAESGVLVPRRCTLDGFSAEVARTDGVYLRDLDPITNPGNVVYICRECHDLTPASQKRAKYEAKAKKA